MKRLAVVATAALLGACSANPAPSTQTVRSTVSVSTQTEFGNTTIETYRDVGGTAHQLGATPDQVWGVLPAVYQGLGIAVGTSLPDTKTIGNTKLVLNRSLAGRPLSDFLSCGDGPTGAPLANNYRVEMALVTVLTPTPNGGTRVETRVGASAANRAVSGATVSCTTTGRLEAMIAERIKNHVG